MKIGQLFIRPIDRAINGVIKADQSDAASVWQELEEYVVTKELDQHFRKFFDSYLNAIRNAKDPDVAGKVGVWVSGFFGSGKSHFIKILSYLLENRQISQQGVSKRAIDFFEGKITDPMLAADIKVAVESDVDVILFNIDSKADAAEERDAILRVFLKVFNEKLGYSSDHPHIAHMERYLAEQGQLDAFVTAFEQHAGEKWQEERDAYQFHAEAVAAALTAATGQSVEDGDAWLERFEKDFSLSVENFARWVREYLDSRGPNHRIIFLVDEVGQFIGQDTHLMLNLQTITENLGTICNGRAWVAVTSQEDIDAVLGEFRASKANEFSRIQGRFRTRLSLSSANVDEVIQKRLLAKVDAAKSALADTYRANADILKNQLSFSNAGMTFKAYADESDFINAYPFAPYQFQLVQKVFESVRKAGATGLHLARGERSMLDAFQSAAIQVSGMEIGALIPLYRFYPSIESFLEGAVKSTIDHAGDNPSLQPFDSDLLKTLFLIRYVDEIKGNVDNLVTLFVDGIDADRLALRNQIEASLQRLEKETLISRNGEDYFFLTNEERDISREIKDVELSSGEEARFLGELIFDDLLKGLKKYRYPLTGKDFGITRICDLHPYGTRTDGDLIVSLISPLADEFNAYDDARCIMQSTQDAGQVIVKLEDDKELGRELRMYLQTEKYVARRHDGTAPITTVKILRERADENRDRRERLNRILEQLLKEASFYAAGQGLTLKTPSAAAAVDEALNYLVQNTFPKLGYITQRSSHPQAEVKAILASTPESGLDLQGGAATNKAEEELLGHITLMAQKNHQILLHGLIEERFGRRPYGWLDWEILILIARLVIKGEISLVMDQSVLEPHAIFDAIETPNRWRRITIIKRQTVDSHNLQKARALAKEVLHQIAPDGEDPLASFLREQFDGWRSELHSWRPLAETGNYPGLAEISDALELLNALQAIKGSYEYINHLLQHRDDLLDLSEDYGDLSNFYRTQKGAWEKLRKASSQFQLNRQQLDNNPTSAAALKGIEAILKSPTPYAMIKDGERLIQTVTQVNDQIVSERRQLALTKIDGHIRRVTQELDEAGASPDLRNQCLLRLQQQRSQVETEPSIAHIYQSQMNARDLADEAINRIEQASQEPPSKPTGVADKAPKVQKSVKKRHTVHPARLSTSYLETEQDMEAFLDALRQEIGEAIKRGERVEVK
jgi:hypothetical protein